MSDLLFLPFSVPLVIEDDFNKFDEAREVKNHVFRQKALSKFLDFQLDVDTFLDVLESQGISIDGYLREVTENLTILVRTNTET